MEAFLRFLKTYESFIYLFLGAALFLYLLRFFSALQEREIATFDLEREEAESKIRNSLLGAGLALLLGVMVFSLVTYVSPSKSKIVLPTPTPNLLAAGAAASPEATSEATPAGTPTPLPTPAVTTAGCKPDKVEITAPKNGDTLQGEVDIEGTAFIPSFGFYKIDIAPATQALFLTIYASHTPVKKGKLVEKWDTSTLPPGDYVLQLVVVDSAGKALPPCRLKVHIVPPKQGK